MALPRTFPFHLHAILEHICDANIDAETSIVSWFPSGKGFSIHNLEAFKKSILPKYFPKQSSYKSFQRQLQNYGFTRCRPGQFVHPFFLRQNKDLLFQITLKSSSRRRYSSVAASTEKLDDPRLLLPELPTTKTAREALDQLIIDEVIARNGSLCLLKNETQDDPVKHDFVLDCVLLSVVCHLRHTEVLKQIQQLAGLMSLQRAHRHHCELGLQRNPPSSIE